MKKIKCPNCKTPMTLTDKGLVCPTCSQKRTLLVKSRGTDVFEIIKSQNLGISIHPTAGKYITEGQLQEIMKKGISVTVDY